MKLTFFSCILVCYVSRKVAKEQRRKEEITALPGVMRYIFSGQDARTTRVSSFNFVPHKSRNRCNCENNRKLSKSHHSITIKYPVNP